jgi:hypothetical protein
MDRLTFVELAVGPLSWLQRLKPQFDAFRAFSYSEKQTNFTINCGMGRIARWEI